MRCFYNIEFTDGTSMKYVPKSLENTDRKMFYFDYYAYKCQNQDVFYKTIKKNISTNKEISKITIDYKRDKNTQLFNAYNVVFDNPYMDWLFMTDTNNRFSHIKREKVRILGTNAYEQDAVVVDKNSQPYLDMLEFVMYFLKSEKETFFKSIYNKKNDFAVILNQYATLYDAISKGLQESYQDFEELNTKEKEIKNYLAKYETYRSLAIARYKYELRLLKVNLKKNDKIMEEFKDNNLDDYNTLNDEFLSKEEFLEMTNGEGFVYDSGVKK